MLSWTITPFCMALSGPFSGFGVKLQPHHLKVPQMPVLSHYYGVKKFQRFRSTAILLNFWTARMPRYCQSLQFGPVPNLQPRLPLSATPLRRPLRRSAVSRVRYPPLLPPR